MQFTPDLMPADITGTEIIEEDLTTGRRAFRFVQGPVFANMVLADEINRTPPKTQAALLQAMQEHQVTAGGTTYQLPDPFFVLATQNPIEQEGTYPLPEAQLDRFMLELRVELSEPERRGGDRRADHRRRRARRSQPVLDAPSVLAMQHLVRRIPVSRGLIRAAVTLARHDPSDGCRRARLIKEYVEWGAGPRASQYLVLGAKARAAIAGRPMADLDDVGRWRPRCCGTGWSPTSRPKPPTGTSATWSRSCSPVRPGPLASDLPCRATGYCRSRHLLI